MSGRVDVLLAAAEQQLVALQAAAVSHPWPLFVAFLIFHAVVFFGSQVRCGNKCSRRRVLFGIMFTASHSPLPDIRRQHRACCRRSGAV